MQHRHSFLFAAALAAGLACAGTAIAATTYNAIDVGTFGSQTFATGLNNLGQVVGYGPSGSFITDANGTNFRTLTFGLGEGAKAFGINDAGQLVGQYFDNSTGNFLAFTTGANGTNAQPLNTLDGVFAAGYAINNDGQIAGYARRGTNQQVFTANANSTAAASYLSMPGGPLNAALAINSSGQLAGGVGVQVDGYNYVVQPFISGPNGSLPLSTFQTAGIYDVSIARGVNDAGWLVGTYTNMRNDQSFAFVAGPNGAAPVILPKMSNYGQRDIANDINNLGQIVGQGDAVAGGFTKRAFISDINSLTVTDLNTLLSAPLPEGVYLINAVGINDLGQIAVTGSDYHVYLLNPVAVPEASTVSFAFLGLAAGAFIARRHKATKGDPITA